MQNKTLGKNVVLSDSYTEEEYLVRNDEKVVDTLKQFDLSTYESLAYYSLLKMGTADVNTILRATKIPTGRVYDVLNSLVHKGLLTVQETRPKKYIPIDPSKALNKLINIKKENFDSEYSKLKKVAAGLEEDLNSLKGIKRRDNTFWSLILEDENAHDLICERINNANSEALVFVDTLHSKELCTNPDKPDAFLCGLSVSLSDLDHIKSKGVDIKLLMDKKSKCYTHIYKNPKQLDKIKKAGYNLRFANLKVMHFDIIDQESVLQRIQNPTNKKEILATIIIKDKNLAKKLRNEFLKTWQNSDPL